MARYTLATVSCACCGSGPLDTAHGPDGDLCSSCAERGMHRCGEITRKGTPCKHWTSNEYCPQHTRAEAAA